MGSKDHSLLNRFDQWLHPAPAAPQRRSQAEKPRLDVQPDGRTGRHRRPPFYLRWWLDAHRE